MTRDEALAEAQRRWGKRAMVTAPSDRGPFGGGSRYIVWNGRVNLAGGISHDSMGSGDSWEAAFADADARQGKEDK